MKHMLIAVTLLMVGCVKNDISLYNKGKKDWQDIEVKAGGKVFEIKVLKGGANQNLLFKSKAEDGGKLTAKLDGKVHSADFGYFTPNMSARYKIILEDNGTITIMAGP